MALPPINITEDVFVREVNEELQKDQFLTLWQRYGKPALGGVIGLLLLWASWLFWQNREAKADGLVGEKFTQVIDSLSAGSDAGVEAKLKEIGKSGAAGYHAPAGLTLASLALQKGDAKAAAAAFGAVVADKDIAQPWRDLALIRQTATEFDTLKPDVAVARLKPIAVAGNPWFGSAGEMTAMAYLKMNKPDLAGKMFAALAKDEGVPETIRNRSSEMANALGVDSARPAAKEGTQ